MCQGIDRLHQGQAVELVGLDDEVGMGDLLFAGKKPDLPRDVALLTDRQRLFDPAALRAEEDELDFPGLVMGKHPVRHLRLAARRRLVAVDVELQRCHMADIGIGDAVHAPAVDGADGHVHEHVERDCLLALGDAEKPGQQGAQLRPDSLDGVQRAKQRIEGGGAGHRRLRREYVH